MGKILGIIAATVIAILAISLIAAYPVMLAWNYGIVPALTIARPISYTSAYCIIFLIFLFQSPRSNKKD